MKARARIITGLILCFCLHGAATMAQQSNYRLKSRLPRVRSAGYYRINLAPTFTARAKSDLADVRLSDGSDDFIPYLKFNNAGKASASGNKQKALAAAKPRYVPIKLIHFKVAHSPGHISHIYINFEQAHHVDKIKIVVPDSITDYHREINIRLNDATHRLLSSTALSDDKNEFYFSAKAKSLDIEVSDKDSLPLPILSVGAYQIERYLVAKLDPNKSYYLLLSDPKAIAPSYDLKYFTRRSTRNLPQITHQNMSHNPAFRRQRSGAREQNNYWIWITIAAALGIVTASGYGMMEEIYKRGEKK